MKRLGLLALCVISYCTVVFADGKLLSIADVLNWKQLQSAVVSGDGAWFAYHVAPNEGDAELVLRNLKDGKETRFPVGAAPAGPPPFLAVAAPSSIRFSEDSKWLAFAVFPKVAEAKKAKKEKKQSRNKMILVELATAAKSEFDQIRRFSFAGERGGWIAMQRYTPEGQKTKGSDLVLRELSSGDELNTGNVAEFAFDKKGNWMAFAIDAAEMAGNGVQLRNMSTGALIPLDSAKASYQSLTWTENGDGLAVLRGVEDKAFEDKLYSVVGFKNLSASAKPEKFVFDLKTERNAPPNMTVSPNRSPFWTKSLSAIVFGIHEVKTKKEKKGGEEKKGPPAPPAADEKERADLVLWHWLDPRLQPMQKVQQESDKNFSFTSIYHVAEKRFVRLADEKLRTVSVPEPHTIAIGTDDQPYELNGNLNGQRFRDIYTVNLNDGSRKLALQKARWYNGPSPDAKYLAYYEDGHHWVYDVATGEKKNLSANVKATSFVDTTDDHNVLKPPARTIGWSSDSRGFLVTDQWDVWRLGVDGKAVNLTGTGKKDKISYRTRFRLDPEEKGVDLAKAQYFTTYGEWNKKGGIARIDPGAKQASALLWSDHSYNGLMKAKHADVYFYRRESNEEFPDYLSGDSNLASAAKVTSANPQQKEFAWSSGVRLIDYTSDKGDKLQGALYLPANYEPGKKYPTVVYIYEKLSQGANRYEEPSLRAFVRSQYTNRGYAVFTPDIVYKLNDPGMSSLWCVVPAVKAAVATGVVDADRVGLHGHSWGGYQTAFLVTQTNIFKTAIAGAPLTDLISMYSSIYWNSGSTNQPIFESSQGRFTSGYHDNLDAYIRNSPVFHASKVQTPLMILHNDKDGAVDFTQGIEYYNTLRRLKKPVIMLQYTGENHGLRVPANMKDYQVRMAEYFDHHLKGAPAPSWMTEGVPLIKVKEHLDSREALVSPAKSAESK